ncbi:virulence-associated E family protein [Clostridium tyrobutyricum]|uniref:virulence-associated E family protein n=1 Tax=Clostridium tyrobutyricum TaxID=1519 RepID=UPI001C392A22|nr:virulence-associated E family protein [Clostridium tyrobutyricum]MBV4425275.1 virulence-associated E family protein [Clostridium tyrobutyricum]
MKLKYDGLLTISMGKSRKDIEWINKKVLWSDLVKRLSSTVRTNETFDEYKILPKSRRDEIKDVGGFVGGCLKGSRRKKDSVLFRQIVTLDADFVKGDLWSGVETILGYSCAMYSTHKHKTGSARLRLVIPLKRPVSGNEYQAISRKIAADLGIDFFDDTTYQPHRLMYWPSTSLDGEFVFEILDLEWINPDDILKRYVDWRNSACWPQSSRIVKYRNILSKSQKSPRDKSGIIGEFCRTYSVKDVIDKYLNNIYEPCKEHDRYTYMPGSSKGGLVIYGDDDFVYSNHSTDPMVGRLCNSFDLLRIHRFGNLDKNVKEDTPDVKLPSYLAMLEFAKKDLKVKKTIDEEKMSQISNEFKCEQGWKVSLEINKRGELKNTLSNMVLILRNDPPLKGLFYNELREGVDVISDVPWKRLKTGWNKTDEASIAEYIDSNYGIYSSGKLKEAILKVAVERSQHPVKEYLNNLPKWDEVERVDELLIKYLGAEDSIYTREVTRKTLVAAVKRAMISGIKFDTVLVLNGPQGIGKSTLLSKLAGEFFSDSLSISDMRDKTAAEKLQGYWILEIGELAGIRKVDEETLKSFLSRQDDKFRASYGYSVEDHPRQCIIIGTTNQENGFLRDITGGRRFWPVKTTGSKIIKPWDIKYVDQIWAEVMEYYRQGESLILSDKAEKIANKAQTDALESDAREGLVREYLNTLLPDNWNNMDLYDRRTFIKSNNFNGRIIGTVRRDKVCVMEIWCELFGKEASSLRKIDSYEINAIMKKINCWQKYTGNKQGNARVPLYGTQRIFVRNSKQE